MKGQKGNMAEVKDEVKKTKPNKEGNDEKRRGILEEMKETND